MNQFYINKLAETLNNNGCDAALVGPGEELEFLLGFSPMMCERFQGLFVKKNGDSFYFCNLLYLEQFRDALPEGTKLYSWYDGDVMTDVIGDVFKKEGLLGGKIAVASTIQAFNVLEIMNAVNVSFVNGKPLLEEMRMCKTHDELIALRDSAKVADQVYEEALSIIHPGATEKEIGDFLLRRMTELGGDRAECIVGVGGNAGYPHYNDNSGVVQEKDVVLMDFGCTVRGMYSDTTRTVFVGQPTEEERKIYNLVLRANLEAEALVKEGAYIPDIDKKAREVLDEGGYASTFTTRLGHGIGYTIHEAPDIKQSDCIHLKRGNAFSIEPGIYFGGKFGVRIEDVVIVNEDGEREVLNKTDKNLTVLEF